MPTKSGNGAVDDARVAGRETCVVEPVARQRTDLEVLHEHIGLARHLHEQGRIFRTREVESDRALVAIGTGEVRGFAFATSPVEPWGAEAARVVARSRTLHLDDVGSQVGEKLGGPGTGEHTAHVDDADAAQGTWNG